MNEAILKGNLVDDVQVKNVGANSTPMASFRLATQRSFKDKDGTRPSDFHNCVLFGNRANALANYTSKGSQLLIRAEIQNDNYKDENGKTHYGYQLHVNDFEFIGGRPQSSGQGNQSTNSGGQQPKPKSKNDPFANESTQTNISDDDLPF